MYDFATPSTQVNTWLLLRQTHDALFRVLEIELAKQRTSPAYVDVLWVVSSHEGPTTPAEISRWLFRQPHTVSALLDRMERDGLITKSRGLEDRRLVSVQLTAKGKDLYDKAGQAAANLVAELLGAVSDPERERLAKSLRRLRQAAAERLGSSVREREASSWA